MDAGPEAITNAAELARVRRQARRVQVRSLVWAALLSALVVAVPW